MSDDAKKPAEDQEYEGCCQCDQCPGCGSDEEEEEENK